MLFAFHDRRTLSNLVKAGFFFFEILVNAKLAPGNFSGASLDWRLVLTLGVRFSKLPKPGFSGPKAISKIQFLSSGDKVFIPQRRISSSCSNLPHVTQLLGPETFVELSRNARQTSLSFSDSPRHRTHYLNLWLLLVIIYWHFYSTKYTQDIYSDRLFVWRVFSDFSRFRSIS